MVTDPRLLPFPIASTTGELADADQIVVDRTDFANALGSSTGTDVQSILDYLDENLFTLSQKGEKGDSGAVLPRPIRLFSAASETIDDTNLSTYKNVNSVFNGPANQLTNIALPSNALTTDDQGAIVYPYVIQFSHVGGVSRGTSNRITFTADGDEDLFFNGSEVDRFSMDRGDTVTLLALAAGTRVIVSAVSGSTDPREQLPDAPIVFRPVIVSASSADAFQRALTSAGETSIVKGYAYEIGAPGTQIFGISEVNTGDFLIARVDDPSFVEVGNTDWNVLRGFNSHPVTAAELRFINQVTEISNRVISREIPNSEVNIDFWLVNDDPASTVSGLGDVNGDLGPTANRFEDDINRFNAILYVGIPESYFTTIEDTDIFIQFVRFNSSLVVTDTIQDLQLITAFALATSELSDPVANIRYYRVTGATGGIFSHYGSGQVIRAVLKPINRHYTINKDTVNLTQNVSNLVEAQLSAIVQAKLNRGFSLAASDRAKLAEIEPVSTTSAPEAYTGGGHVQQIPSSATTASEALELASGDPTDYFEFASNMELFPATEDPVFYVVYVDDTITLTSIAGIGTSGGTGTLTEITPSLVAGTNMYVVELPVTTFTPGEINFFQFQFTQITVSRYNLDTLVKNRTDNYDDNSVTKPKLSVSLRTEIDQAAAQAAAAATNPGSASLPVALQRFSDDLSTSTQTGPRWSKVLPAAVPFDITRVYFGLVNDAQQPGFGVNEFEDVPDVQVDPLPAGNTQFNYDDSNRRFNGSFPGQDHYVLNSAVPVRNVNSGTDLTNDDNKIYGFSFSPQRVLSDAENFDALKLGSVSGSPALLGFSHQEGLYLNIGRNDGGQRSRTYDVPLQVVGGHWHDLIDEVSSAEAEVVIPDSLTGALTIKISIQLSNNGNDEGTHEETITIASLTADEALGSRTFNFSGFPGVITDIDYDAVNDDTATTRRVLFIRPADPFTNAALTYNVAAVHEVTENWNVPATYARQSINAGDAHDSNGLFNPSLWHTEGVRLSNRVLLLIRNYRLGDTDPDPEQAIFAVVDGEREGESRTSYLLRTHRPASEFNFSEPDFGNSVWATGALEIYDEAASSPAVEPTEANMLTLYSGGRYLGYFHDRGQSTDKFTLAGRLDLDPSDGNPVQVYEKLGHSTLQFDKLVDDKDYTGAPVDLEFPAGVVAVSFYDFLFIQQDVGPGTLHTSFALAAAEDFPLTGGVTATISVDKLSSTQNGTFNAYGIKLR